MTPYFCLSSKCSPIRQKPQKSSDKDFALDAYNVRQLYGVCHLPTTLFPDGPMASINTMASVDKTGSQMAVQTPFRPSLHHSNKMCKPLSRMTYDRPKMD